MKLHIKERSQAFLNRVLKSAWRAEKQQAQIEFARKTRPAFLFGAIEGVIGVCTLCSAASRKRYFSWVLGVMLLFAACGHFFLDIREQKILDLLSEKFS